MAGAARDEGEGAGVAGAARDEGEGAGAGGGVGAGGAVRWAAGAGWAQGPPRMGISSPFFFVRPEGADLHQHQLDEEPLVLAGAVGHVGRIDLLEGPDEKMQVATRRLLA